MKLLDLIARDRVLVPLEAASFTAAAQQLVDAAVASGVVENAARLRAIVEGTRPEDVVVVGPAFLLHSRTDAVAKVVIALGVLAEPVQRGDESGKEARIVVLIVAPPKETSQYLQTLTAFAKALGRDEVVEALLAAKQPDDVLASGVLGGVELPGHLTVRDVMVRRAISVHTDTPLGAASALMAQHDVHTLPVVSDTDEVLGMVSHRELLRHLLPLYVKRMGGSGEYRAIKDPDAEVTDPHDMPVRDVMDRSVLCISEDQSLADVATMMINRNIERFPVVREGALVGFLTRADLVRRLITP